MNSREERRELNIIPLFLASFIYPPKRNPQTSCLSMLGGECREFPFTLGRLRRWRVGRSWPLNVREVSKASVKLKSTFSHWHYWPCLLWCRWWSDLCSSKATKRPVISARACAYFPHPSPNNPSMIVHTL